MTDLLTISDVAQEHFKGLLSQQDEKDVGIRVFVINGGTPQAECGVSFCPSSAVEDKDLVQEFSDFKAFIDPESAPYLEDAEVDYVEEKMGAQLTLRAPNAKARKVADDAPLLDRVNYIVEAEINPQLASHGGHVKITEITKDNIAILQFGGGCQGCGMADVTLKEGVEKTLMEKFNTELKGVMDVTEHAAGENPYY
jgi:Fe/S biogenesis protein NfuA